MTDNASIWLSDAKMTHSCGSSLARSLYDLPVTIELTGELGAGKTTFLQGLAEGLGISDPLTSPTFALEQRYCSPIVGNFIHLDLYRLEPKQAAELIEQTDDHEGVRCIEWADRLSERTKDGTIQIVFTEGKKDLGPRTSDLGKSGPQVPDPNSQVLPNNTNSGRTIDILFNDIPLPSREMIEEWRKELQLSDNIVRHCDAVGDFAHRCTQVLNERGLIARPQTLRITGETHDLLRFVDFRGKAESIVKTTDDQKATWEEWKNKYAGMGHEDATAAFLRERQFDAVALIIATHGLRLPSEDRQSTEQKVLFYADKRVKADEIVSLEERFRDFNERYADSPKDIEQSKIWSAKAQELEKELFPEGPPS